MFTLAQLKFGFTTNSSSMHSIILVPPGHGNVDNIDEPGRYERNYFRLVSKQAKMEYFGTQIKENLLSIVSPRIASIIASQICGQPIKEDYEIDHQSVYAIPLTFKGDDINVEFAEELKEYFLRKDVVIMGGDDNVDEKITEFPKYENADLGEFTDHPFFNSVVAKKQKEYWTLFDKENGTKISFSFKDNPSPLIKGDTPDIVDMKITNYCDQKCPYCYQGSTKRGVHAKEDIVHSYIDELSEHEVLEIAFGGGEPTKHPNFVDFITKAHYLGIVPSFSTRSVEWMKNPIIADRVREMVKGIGFSVGSIKEVSRVMYYCERYKIPEEKIVFHCVMETLPYPKLEELVKFITLNGFRVLLLGYKDNGRGATFTRHNNDGIISYLQNSYIWQRFGIDTSFARKYKKQLEALNVSKYLYYTEEGKFSCYIDAVNQRIGPSSYCDKKETKSLKRKWKDRFFGSYYSPEPSLMDFFREF